MFENNSVDYEIYFFETLKKKFRFILGLSKD